MGGGSRATLRRQAKKAKASGELPPPPSKRARTDDESTAGAPSDCTSHYVAEEEERGVTQGADPAIATQSASSAFREWKIPAPDKDSDLFDAMQIAVEQAATIHGRKYRRADTDPSAAARLLLDCTLGLAAVSPPLMGVVYSIVGTVHCSSQGRITCHFVRGRTRSRSCEMRPKSDAQCCEYGAVGARREVTKPGAFRSGQTCVPEVFVQLTRANCRPSRKDQQSGNKILYHAGGTISMPR